MRSDGFSMFEALLAATLFSVFGLMVVNGFFGTVSMQSRAVSNYTETELARSVLEEYVALPSALRKTSGALDRYEWEINEVQVPHSHTGRFNDLIDLFDVEIRLWREGREGAATHLVQTVARRAKE